MSRTRLALLCVLLLPAVGGANVGAPKSPLLADWSSVVAAPDGRYSIHEFLVCDKRERRIASAAKRPCQAVRYAWRAPDALKR